MSCRTRAHVAVAAACLALTACGSTVQLQGSSAVSADGLGGSKVAPGSTAAGDGLGTPGGGALGAGAGAGTGGAPGTAGASGTAGQGGGTAATAGSATAFDPARAPVAAASKKPVEVGIVIYPDVKEYAALFGASGSPGDQKGEAQTAVNWVNTHGGLNGHKVVPVFFEVELTSTQPYAQTYQQICDSFTQDHKVVAAIFIGNAEAGLPSCLGKKGVLFVGHGHYLRDHNDYRSLSNVVTPNDPDSLRVARSMVEQMLAKGLVKRGEELGLLVMNYDAPRRGAALMTSLLKEQGVSVFVSEIPYPQSTQDISNSAAVVQSAELNMASRGIKTVSSLCPGCVGFFMTDAESQQYYPTYVVSSFDTVGGMKGQGHGRSLDGAVAVGWDPMRDVGTHTNPGELAGNTTHQLCRTIEKAYAVDDTSEFASQAFCGAVQDLYAAAKAAGSEPVTGASLMAGFERLGTSHPGTANFSTVLSSAQHAGVASYKVMAYQPGCDCFRYENKTLHPFS
jgi:hypothetical protein